MYKRFRDGILAPKAVVDYMKDKWYMPLIMILIYAILLSAPMIVTTVDNMGLTYSDKNEIKVAMARDNIPFEIINGELVQTSDVESYSREILNTEVYIGLEISEESTSTFGSVFSLQGSTTTIALLEKGVYLYQNGIRIDKVLEYASYDELNNFDLSTLSDSDSDNWITIFRLADTEYSAYQQTTVPVLIIGDYLFSIISILFIALIVSVTFALRFHGVLKYGPMFKLSIYYTTPYVIGYFITIISGIVMFEYIGVILSVVYSIIGAGVITKRIMSSGGKKNEL